MVLLSAVAVARVLGTEHFGELGIIQSTVAMFQVFAGFGLGLTATKYVAAWRTTDPHRAGRIIGLSHLVALVTGGGAALLLFAGADWLAAQTLAAPQLAPLLRIAAPILLLAAVNGSQTGALAGFEAFRAIAAINLYSGLSSLPFMVAGVYVAGIRGAVWALLGTTAVACALSHFAIRKVARRHLVPIAHRGVQAEAAILWRFTAPAVMAGALVQPVHWLCNALLVRSPSGYSQMGLLNAANQWRSVVMFIPTMMAQAALPILASTQTDDRPDDEFRRGLRLMQSLMVGLAFPAATVLMFGADVLLRAYGDGYLQAAPLLIGTIATATVQSIGAATGPAIEARGRMWFALALNGLWALCYGTCVYATVDKYGANALAYGQVAAYSVITVFVFVCLRSELPDGLLSRAMASLVCVWLLAAGALYTRVSLRVWLAAPALAVVTLTTALFLVDREVMRSVVQRVRTGSRAGMRKVRGMP